MKLPIVCNRLGSIYSMLVLLALVVCGNSIAQPQPFTISLETDKSTYVLGESVGLKTVISYNGNAPLDVNNPLDNDDYKERIEIAFGDSGDFKRFLTWAEAKDALNDRSKSFPRLHWVTGSKTTYNNNLFCWRRGFIPDGTTNLLVFPKTGSFQIKYTISFGKADYLQTTTIVFIEPETDADRKAWQWLQKQDENILEEYGDLDHLLAVAEVRTGVLGHLNELLNQYPESAHAKYVNLQLTNALSAQRAAHSTINPPLPPAEKAIKDLEAEWYDVKGYWRDIKLPGARDYAQKRTDLYELQFSGQITEAERSRREAEMITAHIRKYCQPLPPAEWKRLNDGYAKEIADRMAQQVEDMKSHAVENERLLRAPRTNTVQQKL